MLYKLLIEAFEVKGSGVYVHQAGTGTIYVSRGDDVKIRIADHEPNYGAPRGKPTHLIYTKDLCGRQLMTAVDVVLKVADILGMEPANKEEVERLMAQQVAEAEKIAKLALAAKKELQEAKANYLQRLKKIAAAIEGRESEVEEILRAAEAYGAEASNGKKRRKRKASFFKRAVKEAFGIEFTMGNLADIRRNFNI